MPTIFLKRCVVRAILTVVLLIALMAGAGAQSPPTIAKAFSAPTVGLNESVTLTFISPIPIRPRT